ncbi:DUF488 family protein [Mesorhizobium wenxiniae]|uniref:DNA repair protein n=1 Tax=Mesorhizobium wenxiniae TaxID=2014805 RepID=A0A271KJ70_9HYPH|nr:DUF488 domain-containing protein [Mesorhizobium wenxiniae]PAP95049.1 DNA repair protein [Mesorhizobium wenxiniae]
MANPFFSVGHSNRSLHEFLEILRVAEIGIVADVRRSPGSRTNPQFDQDRLSRSLAEFQIAYEHLPLLGGRRGKTNSVAPELNGAWRNSSFHNYADYALSQEFQKGLAILIDFGRARRCAMMCSEAVWWRCHRRIVSDHLLARGEDVCHLMDGGRAERAVLTSGAVIREDELVIYPSYPWSMRMS